MSWIKRFLYGLLIGVTSIAPGISGGTIAIALGFYHSLINAVANILKEFRKNFSYLMPFGIGAIISIAALSVALEKLFTNAPLPTNALFIGLIMGTFPFIKSRFKRSLDDRKAGGKHIITGCIFFIIVLIPVFTGDGSSLSGFNWNASSGIGTAIIFTLIGIIIAATTIIPGLSGTMIMMTMGVYHHLLELASSAVTAAVNFDIPALMAQMPKLIPLGLGVVIGGFLIARALNALFELIPSYIYAAVIGLLCATPIVLLAQIPLAEVTVINVIISILTLVIGLILVKKLETDE